MSFRCFKCDAYFSEWNSQYLCSECRRNEDFAQQQAQTQREIERSAHLNEIKRKLLDLAIEGLEDRDSASKKIAVLMKSSDFRSNLEWFWSDITANPFLLDVYFGETLAPLESDAMSEEKAIRFFDGLHYFVRPVIGDWLSKQGVESTFRSIVSEKYQHYEKALARKSAEQQRESKEREERTILEEAEKTRRREESNARLQALDQKANTIGAFAALPVTLLFLAGLIFAGFLKLPLWIERGAQASVGLFGLMGLAATFLFFGVARNYVANSYKKSPGADPYPVIGWRETRTLRGWLYFAGLALIVWPAWVGWNELSLAARIGFVAAAFAVPLVPFVRGVLGSTALGLVAGLMSLLLSYLAGGFLSGVLAWITKSYS